MRRRPLLAVTAVLLAAVPATASADRDDDDGRRSGGGVPTLEGRALLPADATAPAPFAGAPNTEPAPGGRGSDSRQPVGGFSALLDADGKDTFWAMPDNGFGNKANSRSFLLRVYRVRGDFETRRGGSGDVKIRDWITLRDPDGKVPFAIVRQGSRDRLLTGGDFDVESMRVDRKGDLWFGEEFGPFLLHTDRTGKVLEAPIELPGVRSPDHPGGGSANLARSNGFEGMAISEDRRTLYPILEGPVAGDDTRARRVHEFDIAKRRYEKRLPDYRVSSADLLVADFTHLRGDRYVALERDNLEGAAARHKRGHLVELGDRGSAQRKRQVVDLLDIADPHRISPPGTRTHPPDIGIGDPFSMPYVTIESVLPVGGGRLAIVNDTNFGGRGRNPNRPDDSDFIVVDVPGLDRGVKPPLTLAVIGDTPYGDEQVAQFPALVSDVNADPDVETVLHLGDIKNGSSTCTDERFSSVKALYDTFADPFVFTPGDNEWTDCHRPNNGGFLPTERLAKLRDVFYPNPGLASGGRTPMRVRTQAHDRRFRDYVENQLWTEKGVVFSTVHMVGSNNGLAPWFTGDGQPGETPEQTALRLEEFEGRRKANLAWIDETFDRAERRGAPGVVVGMQADTFTNGTPEGFTAEIERFTQRARRFDGPVLLLQGDTHVFRSDRPLASAPNVRRVVVEGEIATEWLRLEVDPRDPRVFAVERQRLP